jgi:hypothetical protein
MPTKLPPHRGSKTANTSFSSSLRLAWISLRLSWLLLKLRSKRLLRARRLKAAASFAKTVRSDPR